MDYQLSKPFDFTITEEERFVTLMTNEDGYLYNAPKPSFRTVAAVVFGKHAEGKSVPAYAGQNIQDSVIYTNLRVSTEYTLVARIMEIKEDGTVLGVLEDVLQTGANDVYAVRLEKTHKELLIPAIPQCILNVDLEQGRMTVYLLPGLEG